MAEDLKSLALDKAEELSDILKKLLTSGQDYVQTRFGIDLGLKPELYPSWIILSTAVLALLLLLSVSWAGLILGKKRGSPITQGGGDPNKANFIKSTKPEDLRKRNKKKAPEKKAHSNGQPVVVAPEEVKTSEPVSKLPPEIKPAKVQQVQQVPAPLQVKKNKKKPKSDVKTVHPVSKNDGKEPDDGAWETKVSNREKRQQRKKEKDPEDSGGPGVAEVSKTQIDVPVATGGSKKNRGDTGLNLLPDTQTPRATIKSNRAKGSVTSNWKEESVMNNGSWSDMSLKIPCQMGPTDGANWSPVSTAPRYRPQTEPQPWVQDSQAWSGIDRRIKTNLRPMSFTMLGLNTAETLPNSAKLQWENQPHVDDEWSGFNGLSTGDLTSDWNAPAEHWGNYEEAPVFQAPVPPPKGLPLLSKASDDESNADGGAAKSKRKKKKKKKTDEETQADDQTTSLVHDIIKAPEAPVPPSKKQNTSISSSQKKPEQVVDPPKATQKKKIRRET